MREVWIVLYKDDHEDVCCAGVYYSLDEARQMQRDGDHIIKGLIER